MTPTPHNATTLAPRAASVIARAANAAKRLGVLGMVRYDLQRARRAMGIAPRAVELRARRSRYPLSARPESTDFTVFGQTFISEPYACLDDLTNVELIVDCGANVGYASAFLLTQFPKATVVALEPDAGNFEILERNLAPYGSRAMTVRAGVWSRCARLRIEERPYRDGGAWALQVREARAGESSDIEALDIPAIMSRAGRDRISLLKLDIEGSECVVFGAPDVRSWLPKVDCLAVELHDDTHFGSCTDVFSRAIDGQGFAVSRSRELTICRR